jgi:hypothetical protein
MLLIPSDAASVGDDRGGELRAVTMDGPPLGGGEKTTFAEAQRTFPATFFRPDVELASDRTLKALWMRLGGDPELYVEYESGIVVTVRPKGDALGTSEYQRVQDNDGVPGSGIELGDGIVAFEVPQSDEGDLGSVRMVVGDAVVVVIGQGDFPPETLRDVARSILP